MGATGREPMVWSTSTAGARTIHNGDERPETTAGRAPTRRRSHAGELEDAEDLAPPRRPVGETGTDWHPLLLPGRGSRAPGTSEAWPTALRLTARRQERSHSFREIFPAARPHRATEGLYSPALSCARGPKCVQSIPSGH